MVSCQRSYEDTESLLFKHAFTILEQRRLPESMPDRRKKAPKHEAQGLKHPEQPGNDWKRRIAKHVCPSGNRSRRLNTGHALTRDVNLTLENLVKAVFSPPGLRSYRRGQHTPHLLYHTSVSATLNYRSWRLREILTPDSCNPMTYNASLLTLSACSSSEASHSPFNSGTRKPSPMKS